MTSKTLAHMATVRTRELFWIEEQVLGSFRGLHYRFESSGVRYFRIRWRYTLMLLCSSPNEMYKGQAGVAAAYRPSDFASACSLLSRSTRSRRAQCGRSERRHRRYGSTFSKVFRMLTCLSTAWDCYWCACDRDPCVMVSQFSRSMLYGNDSLTWVRARAIGESP